MFGVFTGESALHVVAASTSLRVRTGPSTGLLASKTGQPIVFSNSSIVRCVEELAKALASGTESEASIVCCLAIAVFAGKYTPASLAITFCVLTTGSVSVIAFGLGSASAADVWALAVGALMEGGFAAGIATAAVVTGACDGESSPERRALPGAVSLFDSLVCGLSVGLGLIFGRSFTSFVPENICEKHEEFDESNAFRGEANDDNAVLGAS